MHIGNQVILLGADPELFLASTKSNKLVSAIGQIEGDKEDPFPVKELGEGFAYQADNVLLEYNIPPARKVADWESSHSKMLDYLKKMLEQRELKYRIVGSAEMPDSELLDPRSRIFGCDPSFNVWTLEMSRPIQGAEVSNLRSAGGHVHIGVPANPMDKVRIARGLDVALGLSSVVLDKTERQRRRLYGQAGEVRFKPYGLEYRTLGNFWLRSKQLVKRVGDVVHWVCNHYEDFPVKDKEWTDRLRHAIDEYDVQEATNLINECNWSMHLVNE